MFRPLRRLVALSLLVGCNPALAQQTAIQFVQTDRFELFQRLDWNVASSATRLVIWSGDEVRAFSRSGSAWVPQTIEGIANCPATGQTGNPTVIDLTEQWLVIGRGWEAGPAGFREGIACVFTVTSTGFSYETRLSIPDARNRNLFGGSVSVAGDTIVVGAPGEDASPTIPRSGSAYVFVRDGSTWAAQAKLTPPDGSQGDRFGSDAAIEGNRILVGAQQIGAAYVFDRVGTQWALSARLDAPEAGNHVALEGNVAAVSGHARDEIRFRIAPLAFVFERVDGAWARTAQLQAHPEATFWGQSVTLSGGRLFVGAPGSPALADTYPGTLSYYRRGEVGWDKAANFEPNPQEIHGRVGKWVTAVGDRVILSSSCIATECNFRQTFYTFLGLPVDDNLLLGNSLRNASGAAGDRAGESIVFAGDLLIVGAPGADSSSSPGEVYVFALSGTASAPLAAKASKTASLVATLSRTGGAIGDKFGAAVAATPDGATILVGAPGVSTGVGEALMFRRPASGWANSNVAAETFVAPVTPNIGYKGFGAAVAVSAGGTVVVGAPDTTVGTVNEAGAAAVYEVVADDYSATPSDVVVAPNPQANASFGAEVDVEGEVVAVAAPEQDRPGPLPDVGAVYTFRRLDAAAEYALETQLTPPAGAIGDKFGAAISLGGVPNAEPIVVVGAPGRDTGSSQDTGTGWVFEHDGTTFVPAAQLFTGGRPFDRAGLSIEIDANAVVIGAPEADRSGEINSGSAFVFRRPASGWLAQAKSLGKSVSVDAQLELPPATLQSNQFFGAALALSRSAAYVSAAGRDVITAAGVRPGQGEVDVFIFDVIFEAGFE